MGGVLTLKHQLQLQLQQTTSFSVSLLILGEKGLAFYMNCLSADFSHEISLKKQTKWKCYLQQMFNEAFSIYIYGAKVLAAFPNNFNHIFIVGYFK